MNCIFSKKSKNVINIIYFRYIGYSIVLTLVLNCLLFPLSVYRQLNCYAEEPSLGNSKRSGDIRELQVRGLNRALSDDNPEVRVEAIDKLARLNSLNDISLMHELLLDNSTIVRVAALNGISKMGNYAENFTPEVIENLSSADDNLKYSAAVTLTKISNLNSNQIKLIGSLLSDKDEKLRYLWLPVIESNPEISVELIPEILQLMKNENPEIRAIAVRGLGRIGKSTYIPQISVMLDDENLFVRSSAAIALGEIGKPAKNQAQKIAKLLKEKNVYAKTSAITSLGLIQDIPNDVEQVLVRCIKDKDQKVSNSAINALAMIGNENPQITDSLDRLLEDKDLIGVTNSLRVYGKIGEPVQSKASDIAKLLNHQNPEVRILAIDTLRKLGENGKKQSDKIEVLLQDQDPRVRLLAVITLIQMGKPPTDLSRIAELLKNNDKNIRMAAVNILAQSGDLAKPQIPRIVELLKHGNIKYRYTASLTLSKMGDTAKDQIFLIVELLKDPNPAIRSSALNTLGKMGQVASGQVKQISSLLNDPDKDVRADAAWAVGQLGPAAKSQIPAIANLLNDKSKHVRINAIDALSNMGDVAAIEATQIAPLLNDEDIEIQKAALIALGRMCKNAPEHISALIEFINGQKRKQAFDIKSMLFAIEAIGECGNVTNKEADSVIKFLYSENLAIRNKAQQALWKMSPLNDSSAINILGATYYKASDRLGLRLLAYHTAAGNEKAEKLIKWVGKDANRVPDEMDRESSMEALNIYLAYWDLTRDNNEMRKDFADRINKVVNAGSWTKQDLPILYRAEIALESGKFVDQANFVKVKIEKIKGLK